MGRHVAGEGRHGAGGTSRHGREVTRRRPPLTTIRNRTNLAPRKTNRNEGGAVPDQGQLTSARVIDVLYRESDKLYYELARDCGLSETAY